MQFPIAHICKFIRISNIFIGDTRTTEHLASAISKIFLFRANGSCRSIDSCPRAQIRSLQAEH